MIRLSIVSLFAEVDSSYTDLVFANAGWMIWVALAGALLAILTLLSYWRSSMPWTLKSLGILLRCLGIGILLVCLLEPLGTLERPKPQANVFAILVDTSNSIDVVSQDRLPAQSDKIKALLSDESQWQRKLSDDFRVRRYTFDSALEPVDTFEGVEYRGKESALYGSLASIAERFRGRPLAGVLLVTDGQATDRLDRVDNLVLQPAVDTSASGQPTHSLGRLGFPVYPVSVGKLTHSRDIRIASITTRQSDFETAPVTIQASITHTGFANQLVKVDLMDAGLKTVQSQSVVLKKDSEPVSVEFRFRPEKSGVQGYQIVVEKVPVAPISTADSANADPDKLPASATGIGIGPAAQSKELTLGNNRRFQVVDRGRGPYPILYVAGRPNWEYKFLKRALEEDDEIQMSSLIRIAKKEAKFSFRDTKVDSANPLFSGFEDVTPEEKEKYDEPVFARLGGTKADQLKKGFPKDAEELFEYSAIILDDLEHDFFSLEQQSLLRQFIAVRGGGLLVLGGQESMRGKGFRNSVLSQILPVYGDEGLSEALAASSVNIAGGDDTPSVRYQMTREGWLQPFLRLAENEIAEKERLQRMPPFEVLNRTKGIKPGASVLAEASVSPDETVPVLVTQRFGKGRTAAFMIGDMWRWGLHHDGPGSSPIGQSWRQMVRWLIADVPKPIQMKLKDDAASSSKTAHILVDVKGTDFKAVDNAQVTVSILSPSGKSSTAQAEGSSAVAGQYESTFVAEEEGVYTATSEVKALDGSAMGSSQLGWVYDPSAQEFQEIGDNTKVLDSIASETGGSVVGWDDLDAFVSDLPSKKVPVSETRVFPLWHQSWVLLIAITCICFEWGLRRRYGLA